MSKIGEQDKFLGKDVLEAFSLSTQQQLSITETLALEQAQQPDWDIKEASKISSQLAKYTPLVTIPQVKNLQKDLEKVADGKSFLLQGGDCAETFLSNNLEHVLGNLRTLVTMSQTITESTFFPVVQVARIAGQYAKPRTNILDKTGLPAYRGDMVNSLIADEELRKSDPTRLLEAYRNSKKTLELMGEFTSANQQTIYASHEALILAYESALLRSEIAGEGNIYDLSGHFVWIGERTRNLRGAHIGLAGLICNPIAIKIGPTTSIEDIVEYIDLLDPKNIPGRLTFVARMGYSKVRSKLPELIRAAEKTQHTVIWQCDPMHGNTYKTLDGFKTRKFEHIIDELVGFFEVHERLGTYPGGIHIEFTGDAVTECLGGKQGITEKDLPSRYETACDPRLNFSQAIELATIVKDLIKTN